MGKIFAAAVLLALGSVALRPQSTFANDRPERDPSLNGLSVIAAFDPVNDGIPESITEDRDGNLFFSMSNTVRKRTPEGQMTTFATIPLPIFALGVKVGPDGCIYNASTSLSTVVGAFVWRTCSPGIAEQFAALDPTGGPNDLAFDGEGNLFVTDPFLGRVYRIDRHRQVTVWLDDPLLQGNPAHPVLTFHTQGVNGIAFDKGGHNLFLGVLDFGRIVKVPIKGDHDRPRPGEIRVVAEDPILQGADGIAFDEKGNLFVAVNAQDRVAAVRPNGRIAVLAEGGVLDGVSSIVFGTTHRDSHTAYLANSAFSRAFGFQPGTPRPALLSSMVAIPGLPLGDFDD